jgi:hypothetical protein
VSLTYRNITALTALRRTVHLICALKASIDDRVDDVFPLILSDLRTLYGEGRDETSLLFVYTPSRESVAFD